MEVGSSVSDFVRNNNLPERVNPKATVGIQSAIDNLPQIDVNIPQQNTKEEDFGVQESFQHKKVKKLLVDDTPNQNLSSESGSIKLSVPELLTKSNVSDFVRNNNLPERVNPKATVGIQSATDNLPKIDVNIPQQNTKEEDFGVHESFKLHIPF